MKNYWFIIVFFILLNNLHAQKCPFFKKIESRAIQESRAIHKKSFGHSVRINLNSTKANNLLFAKIKKINQQSSGLTTHLNTYFLQANNKNSSFNNNSEKGAILRSLIFPGWGQYYQGKIKRSILFSGAFLVSGVGSILTLKGYNDAVKEYNDLREQYSNAVDENQIKLLREDMFKKYDDVNNLEKKRNLFFTITGTVWFLNMLEVVFLKPVLPHSQKISVKISPGSVGLNLALR